MLLLDQDRARWDQLLIRRGLAALDAGGGLECRTRVAALAPMSCKPRSPPATPEPRSAEDTDWAQIVGLYAKLGEITPSPIVELNRAVALAMLFGPEAGLNLVDALTAEPALKTYHLLPSVRGDLLRKLGRFDEARAEFERAASAHTKRARAPPAARPCRPLRREGGRPVVTRNKTLDEPLGDQRLGVPSELRHLTRSAKPSIHNYL